MSFGPHTVTVVRRGWNGTTRDRQNNPVISELGTFELPGCFVQQRNADETIDDRESAVTTWLIVAPPPPEDGSGGLSHRITHIDHYRIAADVAHTEPDPGETFATFRQVGHPDSLDHIDGVRHHLELIVERVQL